LTMLPARCETRKMTTSLVTGGAGFVGSHLTDKLVKAEREVIVIDDLSNGRMANMSAVRDQIAFMRHDITGGLSGRPELENIDEIYHLACYPRQISFSNPTRDCEVNLMGTILCLELARKTGAKVLYTSNTGIVSKPPTLPVDETFAPNPLTPYDTHKLASEYMLKAYHKFYGIRTVTVRFASIYGPRQHVNEKLGWRPVIPEFAIRLLRGESPTIDGDGEQTRDFLYVEDAVEGVVRAMQSDNLDANNGGVFILGTNRETSINQVYSIIARELGKEISARHGPRKAEEILRMRYDYTSAQKTFGFVPKTRLRRFNPSGRRPSAEGGHVRHTTSGQEATCVKNGI
jgi:UDP-glucose 4-epimerase